MKATWIESWVVREAEIPNWLLSLANSGDARFPGIPLVFLGERECRFTESGQREMDRATSAGNSSKTTRRRGRGATDAMQERDCICYAGVVQATNVDREVNPIRTLALMRLPQMCHYADRNKLHHVVFSNPERDLTERSQASHKIVLD